MTEIWMGYTTAAQARDKGGLIITGDRQLEADLRTWLRLSAFVKVAKKVA